MAVNSFVLYLSELTNEPGGISEYTLNLATALQRQEKLKFLFLDFSNRITDTLPVKPFNAFYERKLGSRPGDHFFLTRKINSFIFQFNLLLFYWKILTETKNSRSILLICSVCHNAVIIAKLCQILRLDYMVIYHGLDIITRNNLVRRQFNYVYRNASLLVFNSNATKKLFCESYQDNKNILYVLYPGIDLGNIDSMELLTLAQLESSFNIDFHNRFLIISICRLVKRKGIDIAINALSHIIQENPHVVYCICGIGPEHNSLENLIKTNRCEGNIFLLGKITDRQKYSLLSFSKIFIMPNHSMRGSDFEGFGISFSEASYFANVVVGGKSGGAVEAINDNISGRTFSFESDDYMPELHAFLTSQIKNEAMLETAGKEGKKFIQNNFDINMLTNKFTRFLDNLF